jgi:hypothetical protein
MQTPNSEALPMPTLNLPLDEIWPFQVDGQTLDIPFSGEAKIFYLDPDRFFLRALWAQANGEPVKIPIEHSLAFIISEALKGPYRAKVREAILADLEDCAQALAGTGPYKGEAP